MQERASLLFGRNIVDFIEKYSRIIFFSHYLLALNCFINLSITHDFRILICEFHKYQTRYRTIIIEIFLKL